MPLEQRSAFLDRACRDHTALRAAVDDLLAHHQDDSFLEKSAIDAPTLLDPSIEKPGDTIGRYRLLQEIGEGGFGSVWMAEQTEPVVRRVALKIIKLGMDTREVIARFEAERQALALMDHPNIARVLDAGATAQGRPYFVMELVKGLPITKFCDQAQLGMRDRLHLFRDVCSAISHAHQKGIIHRDIKPSNVMVTLHGESPVVKVIDFGIAKATQGRLTDKTLFTRFEQFIGTPVYMSPEQACLSGLDIDTRSDIYALGILLYELLTGSPPFDSSTLASAGYEEMRRIIREVDPPKPSSRLSTIIGEDRTTLAKARQTAPEKLGRLVETDLDWIVMKAIEKDRSRRYETASSLARDIQNFLDDEPVSATPPSAAYRFRKFARRHKTGLRMAAALLAVLLGATAVSIWQAVRATRAETRTAESLRQVASERDAKNVALEESQAVSRFLDGLLRSPAPGVNGRDIRVVDLLDKAAFRLEADLTTTQRRRASLQATLGDTYAALGLPLQAIPLQERARQTVMQTDGESAPRSLRLSFSLANSYADAGRLQEAAALSESVLKVRREQLGAKHPDTLSALNALATIYWQLGRQKEALAMQEEVVAGRREVVGPEHSDTLIALLNQATYFDQTGERAKAIKILESVVEIQRRTSAPDDPHFLSALLNLATFYANDGNADRAVPLAEEVLPLNRKVFGPEHPTTLEATMTLAFAYLADGQSDKAFALACEVRDQFRKVSGPDHPNTLEAEMQAADFALKTGKTQEALPLLEAAARHSEAVLGPDHIQTLRVGNHFAIALEAVGRSQEALDIRVKSLAALRRTLGNSHPETIDTLHNLAMSYNNAGRHQEALTLAEEALRLSTKIRGEDHHDTLMIMQNLAVAKADTGEQTEALALHEDALQRSRRALGPDHPATLLAMTNLAAAYNDAKRPEDALALQKEAVALSRRLLPADHPTRLGSLSFLATLLEAAHQPDEAAAVLKELDGLENHSPSSPPDDTAGSAARQEILPPTAAVFPNAPSTELAAPDLAALESAVATLRQSGDPLDPKLIAALNDLAAAHGAEGNGRKAIKLGEEALALARRRPNNTDLIRASIKILVPLYRSVDLEDEARTLEQEAQNLPQPATR